MGNFYTRFNRPPNPPTEVGGPSLTLQSAKQECDINFIIARHAKTGEFYPGLTSTRTPSFGDVSEVPDYQQSLNFIIESQNAFDALPSKIRKRFNHNPSDLLHFMADESNREEAISLGLIPVITSENPAQL